jgi:hypothetical protein
MLWGRIALGGFLVEAVLMAITIPVMTAFGITPVLYIGIIGSFIAPFLVALWILRRIRSRPVLHGMLIGVVAIAIYMAIAEAARRFGPPSDPQPWLYYIAGHGLKLLGGGLGGLVLERRERQRDNAGRARAFTARYGD